VKKRPATWTRLIAASLVVFALFLLTSVVFLSRQRVDLVTPDYYTLELTHQDRIDQQQRASELHDRIAFHYDQNFNELRIVYPEEFIPSSIEGDMLLYRLYDSGRRVDYRRPVHLEGAFAGHTIHQTQIADVDDGTNDTTRRLSSLAFTCIDPCDYKTTRLSFPRRRE